jgi:PST family polysaccharide transporter
MVESGSLARQAGDALTWKAIQLAGTKGIFLVRTVILARLLAPDDFGLFAIAIVALGFLMSTTEVGMIPALVHRPQVEEAHYHGAWTVSVGRALAVATVLVVAAPAIAVIFAEPRAVAILRVLAVKPVIDASASIKIAELTRTLNYRRLAFVRLPVVAVETVVSIALATRFGVWALVVGTLMGGVAGLVFSYALAPYRPRPLLDRHAVRHLIQYGRWMFLSGLVAVSASSLTQVVISRQLGAFELGLYFLAAKLAFFPSEVASQVVGDVAFPLYARIQGDQVRVARAFRSILVGTVTLLLPLNLFLMSLAPQLVHDVLGERWIGTEPLIQLLSLVGIAGLFGEACGPLFRGMGYPKWVLALELVQSGLVVGLLWALTSRYGAVGAALAWLMGVVASQVLNFVFARRLVNHPLAGALLPIACVFIASSAGAATVVALGQLVAGLGGFVVALVVAPTVTSILIWLCDRRFDLGLATVLTQTFPHVAARIGLVPAER